MNVFDIIGPVMIGPSSSHTAGAARLGKAAALLLGSPAADAHILLHGSFAKTYQGHGTDYALVGGILKMEPWDPGIRTSLTTAHELGLSLHIKTAVLDHAHPNTVRITLTGTDGGQVSLQGASVGGGNILITEINGMEVQLNGQNTTLIIFHQDLPGVIASVTAFVAQQQANICKFCLNRKEKRGQAIMAIEVDAGFDPDLVEQIKSMPCITHAVLLKF